MLSSGQDFDKNFLDSKHFLKVYFKPSRKNQDFLFLPLLLKPVSLANGHLTVRENTKYQNKKEQTNLDLMTTLSCTLVFQEHNPKKLKKYDGLNDNLRGAVAEKLWSLKKFCRNPLLSRAIRYSVFQPVKFRSSFEFICHTIFSTF